MDFRNKLIEKMIDELWSDVENKIHDYVDDELWFDHIPEKNVKRFFWHVIENDYNFGDFQHCNLNSFIFQCSNESNNYHSGWSGWNEYSIPIDFYTDKDTLTEFGLVPIN